MGSLQDIYQKEVVPKLKDEFQLKNDFAMPKLEKIVLNMGLAEATGSKEVLQKATEQLATIAGLRPRITTARKAISAFKLREGEKIGAMVTLRKIKAWHFLEKLLKVVLPRMRDFRGLSPTNFDNAGNYSLPIKEQILFPEIDYSKIDKVRGFVITLVVKNSDPQKSQKMFELLGIPFRKG